jgi:hypothetical protein
MMRVALPRWLAADLDGDQSLFKPLASRRDDANNVHNKLWAHLNIAAVKNFLDVYTDPNLRVKYDEANNYAGFVAGSKPQINITRTNGNYVNRKTDGSTGYSVNLPRFGTGVDYPFNFGYLAVESASRNIQSSWNNAPATTPTLNQNSTEYLDNERIRNVYRYLCFLDCDSASITPIVNGADAGWNAGTLGDPTSGGVLWRLEEWARLTWPGTTTANSNLWHPAH